MPLTHSITDIQTDTSLIQRAADTHQPILLTDAGQGVAVVQALADYQQIEEDHKFMRAIIQGLDIEAGKDISLDEARARLGIQ